jgi:flavin-dependent dehydrogenase
MKVAVVGGGPIGSYIAWRLGERGIEVTLFEKRKTPQKPCSGLFSRRILNFFPLPKKFVENEITNVKIIFPKKEVEIEFDPPLLAVNRKEFDKYLFRAASKHAKIVHGEVERVSKDGRVFLQGKSEKFDYIIACDGAFSIVRRSLGIPDPEFFLGMQFFTNEKSRDTTAFTWPTSNGFFWKIPRGKRTEYGIMEKPVGAKEKLFSFCKKLKVRPEKIEGAVIPVGLRTSPYERIFLCGDAAGLCKPWSGGGVIWGLTAAEILLENFPNLKKATLEVKKKFDSKIRFSKFIASIVRKRSYFIPRKVKIDTDWLF